jgi:hypothetical protein
LYVEDRYKHKHYHIYIYIQNMFPEVGLLEETRGWGKEGKKDRKWIILKYIVSA